MDFGFTGPGGPIQNPKSTAPRAVASGFGRLFSWTAPFHGRRHHLGLRKAWLGYLFLPWLALLILDFGSWILDLPGPSAQSKIQTPRGYPKSKINQVAPDTGVLTRWPLPPNRGPWQLKWDDF